MKKIFFLFAFLWLFLFSSFIYAASAKPDLAFDYSKTNYTRTSSQATTYNVHFFVINKWIWSVFKNTNSYFNVRCTDKNWNTVKEKQYKWQINNIKQETFNVKNSNFPVTCKIDEENKITESNENNNSYTMKDINSTPINSTPITSQNSNKVDLIIDQISLSDDYNTLTRWIESFQMNFVIKNIGTSSVTINKNNKMVISCSLNNYPLIEKTVDNDVIWVWEKNWYNKIQTLINNNIVRLPSVKTETIKCKVELKWITESNISNNSKNFSFDVFEADLLPDLVIRDLFIKDWNWNIIQTPKLWSQDNYLDFGVYNIGIWSYDPRNFMDGNNNYNTYVFFECYSNVAWEWWETLKFESWWLKKWEWQQVIFPNNLFKTFLTKKWTKMINCYINYKNWTKDKNWNETELRYDNNSKSFTFEVK